MAYEEKEGDISIFKNDKATTENRQPEYTGKAIIDGVRCSVALWVRTSDKSGRKFMSGKIEEIKEGKNENNNSSPTPEDDLPF